MLSSFWAWFYPKFKWINDHSSGIKTVAWMVGGLAAAFVVLTGFVVNFFGDNETVKAIVPAKVIDTFVIHPDDLPEKSDLNTATERADPEN